MPPKKYKLMVTSDTNYERPFKDEVLEECVRQMKRKEQIIEQLAPAAYKGRRAQILSTEVSEDDVDELLYGKCKPEWDNKHPYHRVVELSNTAVAE